MELRAELSQRATRAQMIKLAKKICGDKALYHDLIQLIIHAEKPIPQYGAWLLQHCGDENPELIIPYVAELLELIEGEVHDGVRRGVLRSFADIQLPTDTLGKAADLCFHYLEDPKEAVAVRVFAMTVLWNVCKTEPDLMNELKLLIESVTPTGSAALAARGRMVLKEMKKWKKSQA